MTLQEFQALTARNRLTLIDFYATWCGPCRAVHPVLDVVEERMHEIVDVVRLDVDRFENSDLVNHFRIMSVPTLMLFHHEHLLWRNSGVVSFDALSEVLRRFDRVESY